MDNDNKIQLFNSQLINNYDTLLFDCDGVIYYGSGSIPSSVNVVNRLKQLKKDIFYIVFFLNLMFKFSLIILLGVEKCMFQIYINMVLNLM